MHYLKQLPHVLQGAEITWKTRDQLTQLLPGLGNQLKDLVLVVERIGTPPSGECVSVRQLVG